jgi:HSP20 family protein
MQKRQSIRLKKLHGQLGDLLYEYSKVTFTQSYHPSGWEPAVNAYQCDDSLKICVDLAGIDAQSTEIRVEQTRLIVRGNRPLPEPPTQNRCRRILVMEINYGPFERVIQLPLAVDSERVSARHSEGLLWITLPLMKND